MCGENKDVKDTGKEPLLIESPEDIRSVVTQRDNMAILVEDAFGKFELSTRLRRQWVHDCNEIYHCVGPDTVDLVNCIVINVRKDIFDLAKSDLREFTMFRESGILDLDSIVLSQDEKINIVQCYTSTLSDDDMTTILTSSSNAIGFPQCCVLFSEMQNEADPDLVSRIFEKEMLPLYQELVRLRMRSPLKYIILCMVFLNGKCNEKFLKRENKICDSLLNRYFLKEEVFAITDNDLQKAAISCCPFYLRKGEDTFTFTHDSTYDSLALAFWQEESDTQKFIIANCTAEFLTRVSLPTQKGIFCIRPTFVDDFTKRFKREITSGSDDYERLCESIALKDHEFFTDLFSDASVLCARNCNTELFLCHTIRNVYDTIIPDSVLSILDSLDRKEMLSHACEYNDYRLVNALLAREVEVDNEVVVSAIKGGNGSIFKKVISKVNKFQGSTKSKQRPQLNTNILQEICLSGEIAALNIYIEQNENITENIIAEENDLLFYGILGHSINIVKFCCRRGVDITKRFGKFQETALHTACAEGCIDIVKFLCNRSTDLIHSRDSEEYTPLFQTVIGGQRSIFQYLVTNGADVAAIGKNGHTILHLACWKAKENMTCHITTRYPRLLSIYSKGGFSALHYAAMSGSVRIFEHIHDHFDIDIANNEGCNVLHAACKETNNFLMVKYLTDNYSTLLRADFQNRTPLHYVAMGGSVDVFEYLIQLGVLVNDISTQGHTVLHTAVMETKNEEMIRHLTNTYRHLIPQLTIDGESALHLSVRSGSMEVIDHLISVGLSVDQCTEHGANIIHMACRSAPRNNRLSFIKCLIEKFPSLACDFDNYQRTVLHYAAIGGVVQVFEYLVDLDVIDKPEMNSTVIHAAVMENDNKAMVNHLSIRYPHLLHQLTEAEGFAFIHYLCAGSESRETLERMISKGHSNKDGAYIIHLACKFSPRESRLTLVQFIIDRHSHLLNKTDNTGQSVLHYAAMGGSVEVFELLVQRGVDIDTFGTSEAGDTVLHVAVMINENEEMVYYLTRTYPDLIQQLTPSGVSALHRSVFSGSMKVVDHLIAVGLNINQCTDIGWNIIHFACFLAPEEKRILFIQNLIDHHANLSYDQFGLSALHYAAIGGSIDVFEYFIQLGLDVSHKSFTGGSVLHAAVEFGNNIEMVQYLTCTYPHLMQQLDIIGESALHKSVQSGSERIIEHLISVGLDVKQRRTDGANIIHMASLFAPKDRRLSLVTYLTNRFPELIPQYDNHKQSLLHYATTGGSVEVFEQLRLFNLNINDKTIRGETVLHRAVTIPDNYEMVKHLTTKYQHLLHSLTVNNESALHLSILSGSEKIVDHLISVGMDVDQCRDDGANILHIACLSAPKESMLSLVTDLANRFPRLLNHHDNTRQSVLHYAAMGGSVDIFEQLRLFNLNVNDKSTRGETVLHKAVTVPDNYGMVKHLTTKYQHLLHSLTVDGESALHLSVRSGSVEIVKHLISMGMDINQRDGFGRNILRLSERFLPSDKLVSLYLLEQFVLERQKFLAFIKPS